MCKNYNWDAIDAIASMSSRILYVEKQNQTMQYKTIQN